VRGSTRDVRAAFIGLPARDAWRRRRATDFAGDARGSFGRGWTLFGRAALARLPGGHGGGHGRRQRSRGLVQCRLAASKVRAGEVLDQGHGRDEARPGAELRPVRRAVAIGLVGSLLDVQALSLALDIHLPILALALGGRAPRRSRIA
jgi:hypothetical protein